MAAVRNNCLLGLIACFVTCYGQELTPAFFWSNYRYFTTQNSYISHGVDQADVSDLLKGFSSAEGTSVVIGRKAELIVGAIVDNGVSISSSNLNSFAEPPEAGDLGWIQRKIYTALTSLVIPNTFNAKSAVGKSLIAQIASSSINNASVTIVSDEDSVEGAKSFAARDFKEALVATLANLSSDHTSMLLLKATDAGHARDILKGVEDIVPPATKIMYFVTSNADVSSEPLLLNSGNRLLLQSATSGAAVQPPVYMTPPILLGLLLSFFLLLMLLIGFCCLLSVQSTTYYAPAYPRKGKEY